MSIAVTPAEHRERREALIERIREQGLTGAVLFDSTYVLYYVGFAFIPTERPIALILAAGGEAAMVVPRLEVEHALRGSRGSTGSRTTTSTRASLAQKEH